MTERDPWAALRQFTAARIALGRSGDSLPTQAMLAFNLAHAQARDAVHAPFDADALVQRLERPGSPAATLGTVCVHSAADDRGVYLRRPDLGRRLATADRARISVQRARLVDRGPVDLLLLIADGLSAPAAMRHAPDLIDALLAHLPGWNIGPVVIATQARVALGDEVGELLRASMVAVLIGERPGLSSPDSLGVYVTWQPRVGRTDAERNCVSNVRPQGQSVAAAAARTGWLLNAARRRALTGVQLKDDSERPLLNN